jgi:glycerol uptake facilitator-like aquaporin
MLMGLAMGATIIAIVLSPWGKQSGAHFNPAVTFTFYRLRKSGIVGCGVLLRRAIRWRGRRRSARLA